MDKLGKVVGRVLNDIVKNSIELKFQNVQSRNFEDMEDLNEYKVRQGRIIEIQQKLFEIIPEEMQDLLEEYESLEIQSLCSEIRYFFKEGVKAGLTDLKCLQEIGQAVTLL